MHERMYQLVWRRLGFMVVHSNRNQCGACRTTTFRWRQAFDGTGRISDKIIKVASKRTPEILRFIFDDIEQNSPDDETFNEYYDRVGKDYFYQLLKPLADNETLQNDDYIDWGADTKFQTAIGVGECAE
ncbi:MAG: hypothetical protein IPQ04_12080 [Saprospiraceae bacterium]|nr:hypothetical protein [Saprospiraceae bacterium]